MSTGLIAFIGVAVPTAAMQLQNNIDAVVTEQRFATVTRPEIIPVSQPESLPPLNILLLGVDGRDTAENTALGGSFVSGERSDTTIIMHISSDRQNVLLISIPRDSIVDIPACPTTTEGQYTKAHRNKRFNAAFAYGYALGRDTGSGALCAMHTVESMTNVRLDGFIVVDFNGFKNMVDSLGGVEICIPNAIYAPLANGLRLQAGYQTLDGWQALQFARARTGKGLGDGSDLQRIERQQDLLAAIALNVLSRNMLTSAPTLLQFLGATTSSLTMSDNLASLTGLAGLAGSLQGISPSNIEFLTVPYRLNPQNPNTVVWLDSAQEVWETLRTSSITDAVPETGTAQVVNDADGTAAVVGDADAPTPSVPNDEGAPEYATPQLPSTAADNRPTQTACQ